jgi:hypothetical protein
MYVIRKDTGEEIFRGPAEHAKAFFGNGTRWLDRVVDDTDPDNPVEVEPGAEVTLELHYEDTAAEKILYLADTDWYVIREQETGKPVPDAVRARRSAIRVSL